MYPSQDLPSRLVRLTFTILMALSWAGFCDVAQAHPQQTDNSTADLSPQQLQDAAEPMGKMFQDMESLDRQLSRETFDARVIVDRVGRDPAKLRDWVAKETSLLPYRGVLRGPVGVLMDRLGNSLDRALLLARLLQAAGITARLAQAQLSASEAQQLLSKGPAKGEPSQAPTRADAQAAAEQYAKEHGQDPQKARAQVEMIFTHIDRMAEDVGQGVAEQLPVVLNGVGKPAGRQGGDMAAGVEVVRDHWWVQQRDGEKWIDLDPALTGGQPPQPQHTLEVDPATGRFAIDPALYHQVHVRVIVEQWKDGKLQESPVLEQSLRPSELIGQRIVLSQLPPEWPSDLNLLADPDPAGKFRATVLAQHEWVPVLSIGSQNVIQRGFFDSGEIDANPQLGALGKVGKNVGGALTKAIDAFGALGNDTPAPPKASGVLTAEWIEFVIEAPGVPTRTIRREVFDLIGPAMRSAGSAVAPQLTDRQRFDRGLALLGLTDILPLGCQLSSEFVEHAAISSLLENRQAILNLLGSGGVDSKKAMEEISKLSPFPAPLYNWAIARAAWSRHRGEICLDQMNLVCLRRQLRTDEHEQPIARLILDILANPISVRPGTTTDPFATRLEQGVVDTNVESVVLSQSDATLNTNEVFKRTTAQNIKWVALRAGADKSVMESVKLPADARARIDRELAAGYTVIVPERPVEIAGRPALAWWRVDPASGESLGMNEFGGPSMVEYAAMISFGVATAAYTYVGCGGIAAGASTGKKVGCAVCAAVFGVIAAFALGAAAGVGGGVGAAGKALGSVGGVGGVGFGGMACNAFSGFAS